MGAVVILGSGGRLGAALVREWQAAGETVIGFTRQQLDIGDASAVAAALGETDFDVLVNCAAQTNVDRCETHPEEAHLINATAVRNIGAICANKGARCIHISTDYVFDGEKREPYTEEDPVHPVSVYGASKRAGEIGLLETSEQHLAVRVSWVFGPDRPSFVDQIIQKARSETTVAAIGDKWAVPSYTVDIANGLLPLLRNRQAAGILHLCNAGACTWKEYGQFALDCVAEAGIPLAAREVGHLSMADLKAFIAKRPPYTVMDTHRFSTLTGIQPRTWQDAVRAYVGEHIAPSLRPLS